MKNSMKGFKMSLVLILLVSVVGTAWAEYPDRPIQILVGFKAGGSVDIMARMLAKAAGDELGQPMVVVNKPGGGGAVAATALKNADPDGYTLCFNVAMAYALYPYVTKVTYSLDDFDYIAAVAKFQEAFVSLPDKPWKTFPELIAFAKSSGGLSCAVMTPWEKMVLQYIGKKEGVQFAMVPTKGGAAIMTNVLGGHVDMGFSGGIHASYVKAGKMIVLVGHGKKRLVASPDIPTLRELGYDIALENFNMIAVPKGVSPDVKEKLAVAFEKAVKNPEFVDLLGKKLHFPALYMGQDELTDELVEMSKNFKEVADYLK